MGRPHVPVVIARTRPHFPLWNGTSLRPCTEEFRHCDPANWCPHCVRVRPEKPRDARVGIQVSNASRAGPRDGRSEKVATSWPHSASEYYRCLPSKVGVLPVLISPHGFFTCTRACIGLGCKPRRASSHRRTRTLPVRSGRKETARLLASHGVLISEGDCTRRGAAGGSALVGSFHSKSPPILSDVIVVVVPLCRTPTISSHAVLPTNRNYLRSITAKAVPVAGIGTIFGIAGEEYLLQEIVDQAFEIQPCIAAVTSLKCHARNIESYHGQRCPGLAKCKWCTNYSRRSGTLLSYLCPFPSEVHALRRSFPILITSQCVLRPSRRLRP